VLLEARQRSIQPKAREAKDPAGRTWSVRDGRVEGHANDSDVEGFSRLVKAPDVRQVGEGAQAGEGEVADSSVRVEPGVGLRAVELLVMVMVMVMVAVVVVGSGRTDQGEEDSRSKHGQCE
jgi:hypothetical protein